MPSGVFDENGYEIVSIGGAAGPILAAQSGAYITTPIGVNTNVQQSFTRPTNTTTYGAGDVVTSSAAALITFSGCSRNTNSTGRIVGALLYDSAYQPTRGDFALYLFESSVNVVNDNSAFSPSDAELQTSCGVVYFKDSDSIGGNLSLGTNGNTLYQGKMGPNNISVLQFKTATASTSLYGVLVARNTYTPISQESFTIRLNIQQD